MEFEDAAEDFSVNIISLNGLEDNQIGELVENKTQVVNDINDTAKVQTDIPGESVKIVLSDQNTVQDATDAVHKDLSANTSKNLATKKKQRSRNILESTRITRPSLPRKSKSDAKLLLKNINKRIIAAGIVKIKKSVRKPSFKGNKSRTSLYGASKRACSRCGHTCCVSSLF